MRFPLRELDITAYQATINQLLDAEECHIFIDTNILGRLFKLNGKARHDFFGWVRSCANRFHVPNWVVMEYNKKVYGQKLKEYVGELKELQTVSNSLASLKNFIDGYVDDEKLRYTTYNGDSLMLHKDMERIISDYSKIVSSVLSKKDEHIKQVQNDIDEQLKNLVIDSDIYKLIGNLYFEYQLRLESQIPPGFKDAHKTTNDIGDLIIWQEILQYCKGQNVKKAILITCDEKPDMSYTPQIQTIDKHPVGSKDTIKIAHESMVYEFKLATDGSEEFYTINLYTLVCHLNNKYPDLALSFQMVSREVEEAKKDEEIQQEFEQLDETASQPNAEITTEVVQADSELTPGYSMNALKDGSYLDYCPDNKLKPIIKALRTYNWYDQNDAVSDLRSILVKTSESLKGTENNRDEFFVIGRNLLQSAEGNAFEAVRFIKEMSGILQNRPMPVKRAIIEGCLFEVFFDHNGEIRSKAFKARYMDDVKKQAQILLGEVAFKYINEKLSKVNNRFVPIVGGKELYTFEFGISNSDNLLNGYCTDYLKINGNDCSATFSNAIASSFAEKDDIDKRLAAYYAVPKEKINLIGIPDDLSVLHFIKEREDLDETLKGLNI